MKWSSTAKSMLPVLSSFLVTVTAGVTSHLLYDWLTAKGDRQSKDNDQKATQRFTRASNAVIERNFESCCFRVIRKLGSGNFGNIYLCCDDYDISKKFAIRKVRARGKKNIRASCFREFANQAKQQHGSLAKAFCYWEDGDFCYTVMEYVEGKTLEAVFRERSCMEEFLIGRIILQVAQAVAHMHDNGTAHGDLSTQNVMLLPGGDVKIIDFGLSVAVNGDTIEKIPGLPYPLRGAPEMQASCLYSHSIDSWGLGILVLELLGVSSNVIKNIVTSGLSRDKDRLSEILEAIRISEDLFEVLELMFDPCPSTRLACSRMQFQPFFAKHS